VVDTDMPRAQALADKFGCQALSDYHELAGRLDAVSVAVPTLLHHEVASWLLARGIHVLVEKPLCSSAAQAEALVEQARDGKLVLQVGHIERFNPALREIKSRLQDVAFIECHRLSPFPFRSMDIGVIMDVMIHDLDIILSLVNS